DFSPALTGIGPMTIEVDPTVAQPKPPAPPLLAVKIANVDLSNGNYPNNQVFWSVQNGDYLELYGGGQVDRITAVRVLPDPVLPGVLNSYLELAARFPAAQLNPSTNYRII